MFQAVGTHVMASNAQWYHAILKGRTPKSIVKQIINEIHHADSQINRSTISWINVLKQAADESVFNEKRVSFSADLYSKQALNNVSTLIPLLTQLINSLSNNGLSLHQRHLSINSQIESSSTPCNYCWSVCAYRLPRRYSGWNHTDLMSV